MATACQREVPGPNSTTPPSDPFAGRNPSAFRLSLLLSDAEIPVVELRSGCEVPIRGEPVFLDPRSPEAGIEASVGRSPLPTALGITDEDGITGLPELVAGIHVLEVRHPSLPLTAKMGVELTSRRTEVRGFIGPDARDLDADGDSTEWIMALELMPDDDRDGVSDSGRRSRGTFGPGGALLFRHLGRGTSERVELDGELNEVSSSLFGDRDGDFLADEVDDDADGSGVDDGVEGLKLPCPGFSHDDLFVAGTKHADFRCDQCHQNEQTRPLACADCHAPDGRAPNGTPAQRPADHFLRGCEQCHRADRPWAEIPGTTGEHHQAYPLLGRHLTADCFSCHTSGRRKPPTTCETCHLKDAGLDHFQNQCQTCHAPTDWLPATFAHDQFPLSGGHTGLTCDKCHQGGDYTGLTKACASCHLADAPPKHQPAGFAAEACEGCHVTTSFSEVLYTHPQWTLLGKHQTLKCDRCHLDANTYEGPERICSTCHDPPAFPDHSDANVYGTSCEFCHAETGWVPANRANYDHSQWPLLGQHQTANCSTCHESGALAKPPTDCTSCHLSERPARHLGHFEQDCGQCHQPTAFTDLLTPWMHTTTFPLDGAHATTTCASCHPTSYEVQSTCVSCHQADEPANHYGNDCQTCHTSTDWNPTGGSNHHTADPNAMPLTGGHAGVLCTQCHTNGYQALPRTCESCHSSDTPVGHATSACANCHTAGTWNNPSHPATNALHPLAGGHRNRTCTSCHGPWSNGSFQTLSPSPDCASCHTTPNGHIATGNSPCSSCHQVTAWTPAAGGHTGPLPSANFPYQSWSGRWFPVPHHRAERCDECHTQIATRGYAFFSCTTFCHTNNSGLSNDHRGEHLFHFNPNDANSPPNEGGAVWPTGHVGCVKSGCHADGRE
ncbi:MAG: hypothetical protein IPG45_13865 [Deltaproteobacteria bacterium]|nr:hypothetical protein [Deltaproteobacteria bacterium]